jgi:hypothetical protein
MRADGLGADRVKTQHNASFSVYLEAEGRFEPSFCWSNSYGEGACYEPGPLTCGTNSANWTDANRAKWGDNVGFMKSTVTNTSRRALVWPSGGLVKTVPGADNKKPTTAFNAVLEYRTWRNDGSRVHWGKYESSASLQFLSYDSSGIQALSYFSSASQQTVTSLYTQSTTGSAVNCQSVYRRYTFGEAANQFKIYKGTSRAGPWSLLSTVTATAASPIAQTTDPYILGTTVTGTLPLGAVYYFALGVSASADSVNTVLFDPTTDFPNYVTSKTSSLSDVWEVTGGAIITDHFDIIQNNAAQKPLLARAKHPLHGALAPDAGDYLLSPEGIGLPATQTVFIYFYTPTALTPATSTGYFTTRTQIVAERRSDIKFGGTYSAGFSIGVYTTNDGTNVSRAVGYTFTISPGWHSFAYTFDGTSTKVYWDGVLTTHATAGAGAFTSTDYPEYFGAIYYQGVVGNVQGGLQLYRPAVLSAPTIMSLHRHCERVYG